MFHPRFAPFIVLLLCGVLKADIQSPSTRPARLADGYRMMGDGSWVISQATVRTTPGFPAQVKRKVTIASRPAGDRVIEEATWSGAAYETNGPAQALTPADGRSFDDMGFIPEAQPSDSIQYIGRRRYPCSATSYLFEDKLRKETTRLTLYRDKSQTVRMPPRMVTVGGRTIPLPSDAIAADFAVDGDNVAVQGQRRILLLEAPMPIGDRTCVCVVESIRSSGTRGGKPVSTMAREWHCHELPGEKLKSISTANLGTVKVETDVAVLDFHVNPLAGAAARGPATRAVGE